MEEGIGDDGVFGYRVLAARGVRERENEVWGTVLGMYMGIGYAYGLYWVMHMGCMGIGYGYGYWVCIWLLGMRMGTRVMGMRMGTGTGYAYWYGVWNMGYGVCGVKHGIG